MNRATRNLILQLFVACITAIGVLATPTLIAQTSTADRIELRSHELEGAAKEIEYTVFISSQYEEGTPAPLVVLLHGLGSNPRQVMRYEGITDQAEEHGYIVVAPYGYNEYGWYGSLGHGKEFTSRFRRDRQVSESDPDNLGELSEQDVLEVLKIVRSEYSIDPNRIYLAGHSMGGGGTWYLGLKYPELWAALGPMAPAIYSSPDQLEDVKHLPVFIVQGENDRLVPVEIARRWVEKMKELEMSHEYIEIPEGDHVACITDNPEMIARMFAFFNAHSKASSDAGGEATADDSGA